MGRKVIQPTDRVKFSENDDGTYDLYVNGRIWAYDVDDEDFGVTLRRFKVPLPAHVIVEDTTGYGPRVRIS